MYNQSQSGRHRRGGCNSCCAWTSLIVGVLFLLSLVAGFSYFAFLQSNLPEVHLHRLDVNNLQVNKTRSDTVLSGDFEIRLNMTNNNGRIALAYSKMSASIESEGIRLGGMDLPELSQKPQVSSELRVRTSPRRAAVEDSAARELEWKCRVHLMRIDAVVKGHVHFSMMGKRLLGFPYRVSCRSIDQSEIDNGRAPKCSIKMRPF